MRKIINDPDNIVECDQPMQKKKQSVVDYRRWKWT